MDCDLPRAASAVLKKAGARLHVAVDGGVEVEVATLVIVQDRNICLSHDASASLWVFPIRGAEADDADVDLTDRDGRLDVNPEGLGFVQGSDKLCDGDVCIRGGRRVVTRRAEDVFDSDKVLLGGLCDIWDVVQHARAGGDGTGRGREEPVWGDERGGAEQGRVFRVAGVDSDDGFVQVFRGSGGGDDARGRRVDGPEARRAVGVRERDQDEEIGEDEQEGQGAGVGGDHDGDAGADGWSPTRGGLFVWGPGPPGEARLGGFVFVGAGLPG